MSARFVSFAVVLLLAVPGAASAADVTAGACADAAVQQSPLRPIHQIFDAKSPSSMIDEVLAPYLAPGSTARLDHATVDHLVELATHEHPRTAATRTALRNAVQSLGDRLDATDAARLTAAAGVKISKTAGKAATKAAKAVRTRPTRRG